jgi:hypothetical protein
MRHMVWVLLIERSTGTIGKAGLLLFRGRVIVSILASGIELEELVIVKFRPRARTHIIKKVSNNSNKDSSIIRSKVISVAWVIKVNNIIKEGSEFWFCGNYLISWEDYNIWVTALTLRTGPKALVKKLSVWNIPGIDCLAIRADNY